MFKGGYPQHHLCKYYVVRLVCVEYNIGPLATDGLAAGLEEFVPIG